MKFETRLKKAVNKILDLVSAKEQDFSKKSGWRRWGFDTDCGDNEELVNEAIEILKKYEIATPESELFDLEELKKDIIDIIDYWNKDPSLMRNEGVIAIMRKIKQHIKQKGR